MSHTDQATCLAASDLADAIVAEFNDPSSKLKGFAPASIEKIFAYEKLMAKQAKSRAKAKRPE